MGGGGGGRSGGAGASNLAVPHYMCERRVSDLVDANVYLDALNASVQPSVVRSDLMNLPGAAGGKVYAHVTVPDTPR
jgi:hypothetical protein